MKLPKIFDKKSQISLKSKIMFNTKLIIFTSLLILFISNINSAQERKGLETNSTPKLKRREAKKTTKKTVPGEDCSDSGFWICGRVIDADGNPVSGIDIELSSAYYEQDSPLYYRGVGLTDSNGYFKGLHYTAKPGQYIISINYLHKPRNDTPFPTSFYPKALTKDQAEVFTMDSNIIFKSIIFQLPKRLTEGKIFLTVSYEDGSPADQVTATIENLPNNYYENYGFITDENGFVEMTVYQNVNYKIKINSKRLIGGKELKYHIETKLFKLGNNSLDLNLILKEEN